MNNTYSLDRKQKTGDLNADLILRQYKLEKMAKITEIKFNNPRLKHSEIAKLLELSSSTIQRYRRKDIFFHLIGYHNHQKPTEKKQKTPNTNLDDVKKSSNDLKTTSKETVGNKKTERWCKY